MDELVPKQGGSLVQQSGELSITYPKPSELFSGKKSAPPLREAVILAVSRLAAAVNATAGPGAFDIYADALEDVPARALELAFTWFEKYLTIHALPAPGEIRIKGMELLSVERQKTREGSWKQEREQAIADADIITPEEHEAFMRQLREIAAKFPQQAIEKPVNAVPTSEELERQMKELREKIGK